LLDVFMRDASQVFKKWKTEITTHLKSQGGEITCTLEKLVLSKLR
jgi:hypothetical protein